jgi:hypothetical protein
LVIENPAWRRARGRLVLVGLCAALAGCGARGFAPDSVVENPGAQAFIAQVNKQCGDLNLGTATIAWLIQSQDDVYFVDETTKLYFGEVSKAQYADDMSSFYPVGEGSRSLECIFQQLPKQPAQR